MKTERIQFDGSQGAVLSARLDRPAGPPRATALFAHCFTCSKDLAAVTRISRALGERGIAVLRFDFTGLGHSEGEFSSTNFSSNVADLVCAARYLEERGLGADLLVGHSLGGAAVLAAAEQVPEARAIATIGAPARPDHVRRLLRDAEGEILEAGEADVELAGRRFTIQKQFLEDLDGSVLGPKIRALGRPLMVLHAPLDDTVGVDNAREIFELARHPKSFVSLDRADHLLTNRDEATYVGGLLAAWADRYLEPASEWPRGRVGRVVVEEEGSGKFLQRVVIGSHRLLADEPTSVGGDDAGPSPYDLLVAALGTCTAMTLRMYADRKQWPLEGVQVELKHEKIHAKDCEECAETGSPTAKVDRIERTVELRGELDSEQRERLLEIADRCPVHRTLTEGQVVVSTSEASGDSA